jgi:hypothetical protein
MVTKPIGGAEELLPPRRIASKAPLVVIAQPILRDRDRVILHADVAVIIKFWNAGAIERPRVVRLLREEHVIGAEFIGRGIGVLCRSLVPKGQLALASEEIGTEDSTVVAEPWHLLTNVVTNRVPCRQIRV